jgi:replicative DNA helicase
VNVDRALTYDEASALGLINHDTDNADTNDGTSSPAGRDDDWDHPPSPLGRSGPPVRFPVDVLPGWAAEFVTAEAEATQTPADLAGVLVISALAAAAGGRAVVEVRPGWREPLNIYAAVALPPGARKSPVFARVTSPLIAAERDAVDAAGPAIAEAHTRRLAADQAAFDAQRRAGTAGDDEREQLISEAADALLMAEAVTVPPTPRLLADDATPEALTSLIAQQGGRLAVLSDEGDVFDVIAGRYNNMPNFAVYLKGHAGTPLRVDRKGRSPEHIAAPALTLGLAVQPDVLRSIADRPGFRGRGLLARFLYSLPESNVGRRRVNTAPVPEDISEAYDDQLSILVRSLGEWTDPAVLTLTDDAHHVLVEFEAHLEPRLGDGGDLSAIADWGAKLAGAAVRLAGLLHLAANVKTGWGRPIDANSMACAVRLAHYFAAHALAVFDLMGSDPVLDKARRLAEWCKTRDTFTRREAHRDHQSTYPRATDLDPVLDLLVAHGWIRQRTVTREPTRGRPPSPVYEVNPK